MKKFALTTLAAAMLASPSAQTLADAYIGAQMADKLVTLSPTESMMAVVTYDQMSPLAEAQVTQLLNLGITEGVQFKNLPIIGVVATKAQIEAIAQFDGVRSIFANREMTLMNADAREITGVADLQGEDFAARNGTEFTGKGSTVLVIDSGIDASHQDIFFGDTVVDNVQAILNPGALSIVGITGPTFANQVNTDLNSGHGTHCAGTIAGSGEMSGGKHRGAAPDADLIGYGSGAAVLLLDTIGGFDYAISKQYTFENPIKVISNSWGSSGKYEPLGPVSLASYKAHTMGMISVFAAGNSGPGEDSHNPYAQIPWGLSVGAGDKFGKLADFSSRGLKSESGDFTMPDGTEWTYSNDVSIVAPGVDIISTRAVLNAAANGGDGDIGAIETQNLPFYTMISGTSMATPHVSGIITLMLEANPSLDNLTIKRLLQETATNMPGYERWEVGAGYVNARSAVAAALDYDVDHKVTVNNLEENSFNANAIVTTSDKTENFEVFYSPVGAPEIKTFEVGADEVMVKASADSFANLTKLVLVAPDNTEYRGNLSTPVLETSMRVAAPAMEGTWGVYVYGLTSLSGVEADPFGLTNGPGLPETFDVTVSFDIGGGFEGMDDVEGHPQQKAIEFAVSERLMDAAGDEGFKPDDVLTRKDFARYAVMGGAVRQYRDLLNDVAPQTGAVEATDKAFVESVMANGGALKDKLRTQMPVLRSVNGDANPLGSVTKLDIAYSLVQMLGLQDMATSFDPTQDIVVSFRGEEIALSDQDSIPDNMKGYVQLALDLSLIGAEYSVEQGPFTLSPKFTAKYSPDTEITRAHYAVLVSRYFKQYFE
ncbi:peptidase S8 [Alteromonas sp. V450]|uniref:S8 family peptidase n=1 Tax=Alteromonas sp. V450 TaxID=1912139 RepID=UPI0008FF23F7|nr:S8 family serine peptidase [Alteromonas sp. V450]OJF69402.1 peptidase S8 [Alteromonas sp. V450]